jgi:peptidoglycan hydrolase CwlO-like protein
LYFYGDSDEPNAILAFGVGDRRIATIDVGAVSDKVDEIENSETENSERLDKAIATLKDVINAAGLTFDENKIQNQVTYEPDVKDELIGDTSSLGEAIAVISKFAQDSFKSTNLIPVESKSIAVSYTATDKGMELKPSVKFSTYGDADTLDDNNNILGLKPDGIYATVNLEYDPEKCELSFVTSGMKDGKFMDDANRKVIKLGEHTQYTPDNNGYNVNLVVDKDKNTISANVKISEDPNNILSVQDEKLFVDGRATNIKYKSGTVYSGINQLETSFNDFKDEVNSELDTVKKHISDVEENTTIEGDTTDTMVITATKETNVGYRISGGVRLGSNKTIIHKDGGLEVDIEITCDIASNKLIVRTGNVTKEVELPGVDFIDNAYYDSVTQELVIEFNNGNTVRIPMSGLITTYTFENNTSSPVVFQVSDNTRSIEKVVTTAFRLASNDNILSINGNGELLAPKSTIDNAIAVETENRVAEDKKLSDAITAETQRATGVEATLQENITQESERAKAAELANANLISANTNAIETLRTSVEENKKAIDSLNADENTPNSVRYMLKYTYDTLNQGIQAEQQRAENAESALHERINDLTSSVASQVSSAIAESKTYTDTQLGTAKLELQAEISNAKTEAVNTASSDATSKADKALVNAKAYTDSEIAKNYTTVTSDIHNANDALEDKLVADYVAKDEKVLTDAKAYTDSEIAKLETNEGNLSTSIEELKAKDKELETSLATKIESVEVVKDEANDLHYQVLVDGVVAGDINIPQDQFLKSVNYDNASHKLQFIFKTENEHEQPIEVDISDLVDTYAAGDGMSLSANTFSVRKATLSEKYLTVSADGVSINGIDAAIDTLNGTIDTKTQEAQDNAIATAATDATTKADNALTQAKEYADRGLEKKANSADVYTKEEIDKKGYLTTVDLSGYATKTDVADETSRAQIAEKLNADAIDALEDRATAIETNVSLLQAEDRRLNIITSETNSIALTASKADGGTTLKADLKLNTTEDNIIKLDGNGVYSSVALNYNKAENSIALIVNGNEKSKFTLSEHSLVQEGHYDSVTQSIVLTIAKDGGETQQISIPVGDVVNEWTIDNGTDNPITLTKTAGADNVDVLRARLVISTEPHNGILNNNGTLYVSNEASKLTALWGGDEVTVQKAIENLKTETDKVAGLVSDVDTLKSDMAQAKNDITVLQGNVANLQTKVEQNTQNIAQNTGAINNLTTQVTELGSQVTNLSNQFTELSNQVEGYEDRISKLEGDLTTVNNNINTINQAINQIKEQIGEPEEGKPSVAERLATIEEIINNLIDFGEYGSNS